MSSKTENMVKGEITIVGVGPGEWRQLTLEAVEALTMADQVYFRAGRNLPVFKELENRGVNVSDFSNLYTIPGMSFEKVYATIAQLIVKMARKGIKVAYALPGHPHVFESSPTLIRSKAIEEKVPVRIISGMSFLDQVFTELHIDPITGFEIMNAYHLIAFHWLASRLSSRVSCLIGQVGAPPRASLSDKEMLYERIIEIIATRLPLDHQLVLIKSDPKFQNSENLILRTTVGQAMQHQDFVDFSTSLVLMPASKKVNIIET